VLAIAEALEALTEVKLAPSDSSRVERQDPRGLRRILRHRIVANQVCGREDRIVGPHPPRDVPGVDEVAAQFAPVIGRFGFDDIGIVRLRVRWVAQDPLNATATSRVLAFEITHEIMWVPKWAIDGNKYFSHLVYTGHKITGKITFEHDTAVKRSGGAKSEFEARTAKKLRISLLGSALTTAATHATRKVNFDMPIKYTKVGTLDDMDGNDIVDMEFRSRYNATAADQGSIVVVNQVTALP